MNKKIPYRREFRDIEKEALHVASRLEGKVKNAGIKNAKKRPKKKAK